MKNRIYVVTHKDYQMPKDTLYQPIVVGPKKNILINCIRDDEGENIAIRNNQYSELTALYWIWKNSNSKVVGLAHYRRLFAIDKKRKYDGLLTSNEVDDYLKTYDVILTKPRFYIEGVAKHYINCHKTQRVQCQRQIDILAKVIKELEPEYYEQFEIAMKNKHPHMFNMFVMNKELLNKYCQWLFPILFETEKRINQERVSYERLMGSLSEFLLDVWVYKNNYKIKEVDIYQTEMDFWKRVRRFIYRRFLEK